MLFPTEKALEVDDADADDDDDTDLDRLEREDSVLYDLDRRLRERDDAFLDLREEDSDWLPEALRLRLRLRLRDRDRE
jgi:hypothetical protein